MFQSVPLAPVLMASAFSNVISWLEFLEPQGAAETNLEGNMLPSRAPADSSAPLQPRAHRH